MEENGMAAKKYTKEILETVVSQSVSFSGVLRLLGVKQAGGSQSYITKLVNNFGIDHSHFTGQGWIVKGSISSNRKCADDILVLRNSSTHRTKANQLRRALIEIGRSYECEECGTGDTYNDKPLTLEVDHRNGNSYDDREDNLRFMCPNCHSQTSNYGNKVLGS